MKKITRKIKNIFVPTEDNGQVPLILKEKASYLFIAIAFALIIPAMYFQVSYLSSLIDPSPFNQEDVVNLLNQSRTNSGLPALEINNQLSTAAMNKLEHMVSNNYFAHFAPDGTSPWYFIKSNNYNYTAAGENLAVDFASAKAAHNALMNSESHRANILSQFYSEVGIAVGKAEYQGREAIYVVQMFGNPVNVASSQNQTEEIVLNNTEPEEIVEEPQEESQIGSVESISQEIDNDDPEEQEIEITEETIETEEVESVEEEIENNETESTSTPVLTNNKTVLSVGSIFNSYINSSKAKALTSVLVIMSIATALAFLLTREHSVRPQLIVRSLLVMLIFGSLMFQAYNPIFASKISPVAKANIVYDYVIDK